MSTHGDRRRAWGIAPSIAARAYICVSACCDRRHRRDWPPWFTCIDTQNAAGRPGASLTRPAPGVLPDPGRGRGRGRRRGRQQGRRRGPRLGSRLHASMKPGSAAVRLGSTWSKQAIGVPGARRGCQDEGCLASLSSRAPDADSRGATLCLACMAMATCSREGPFMGSTCAGAAQELVGDISVR